MCPRNFNLKDLDALDAYDVPSAPVHISNSTDPLQPLELEHRHALYTLEKLAQRRHRFTTVTVLTKNPAILAEQEYIRVLRKLNQLPTDHPHRAWFEENGHPPLRVECSLAFHDDEYRELLDPAAPSVESRMEAIRLLSQESIPVFVRIAPLFPRDPLPGGKSMSDFELSDIQPMADLESLVRFARKVGAGHLVYSIAKITRPRFGTLPPVMEKMKRVYEYLSREQPLLCRGGSWRLPANAAGPLVVEPFLNLCRRYSIEAKMCKPNLISTP